MKKLLSIALSIPLLAGGIAVAVPAPKVTICHATSAEDNPWVRIVVSENAIGGHFDNPGTPKAGHEDDLLFQGEEGVCPVPETPPEEDPEEPTEEPETPQGEPETPPVITNPAPTVTPSVVSEPQEVITAGK